MLKNKEKGMCGSLKPGFGLFIACFLLIFPPFAFSDSDPAQDQHEQSENVEVVSDDEEEEAKRRNLLDKHKDYK